jgi:hypothetical protein
MRLVGWKPTGRPRSNRSLSGRPLRLEAPIDMRLLGRTDRMFALVDGSMS